jgi:hypothetical protein
VSDSIQLSGYTFDISGLRFNSHSFIFGSLLNIKVRYFFVEMESKTGLCTITNGEDQFLCDLPSCMTCRFQNSLTSRQKQLELQLFR